MMMPLPKDEQLPKKKAKLPAEEIFKEPERTDGKIRTATKNQTVKKNWTIKKTQTAGAQEVSAPTTYKGEVYPHHHHHYY